MTLHMCERSHFRLFVVVWRRRCREGEWGGGERGKRREEERERERQRKREAMEDRKRQRKNETDKDT